MDKMSNQMRKNNMQKIKQFIMQNPIPAAVIFVVILGIIYFGGSALWNAGHIFILERANEQLVRERESLTTERNELAEKQFKTEGVIQEKEREIKEKDALLTAIAQQAATSKLNLDKATATAADIMGDDSVLTELELREHLCKLYPDKCGK
jgi:hypothetical protein